MSLSAHRHVILSAGGSAPPTVDGTVRFRFGNQSFDPTVSIPDGGWACNSWTRVQGIDGNVWDADVTGYGHAHFRQDFRDPGNPVEILYADLREHTDGLSFFMDDNTALVSARNIYVHPYDDYSPGSYVVIGFGDCSSLTEVTFRGPSTAKMAANFGFCTSLVSVDFDSIRLTSQQQMFQACTSLVHPPMTPQGSNPKYVDWAFSGCTSLIETPMNWLTAGAISFNSAFSGCTSLETINPMATDSAREVTSMFRDCYNVQSGALALYQQMSTQANPPTSYSNCFTNCGRDAPADAPIHAEMAQIPASWGGLGA